MERAPQTEQENIEYAKTPQEKEAERKRKAELTKELIDKYLTSPELQAMSLEDLVALIFQTDDPQESLEWVGISKDANDRYRLKMPGVDALGQYENPDALKSFLKGFSDVRSAEDLYDVLDDVFEYVGVPFKRPNFEAIEEDETAEEQAAEAEIGEEIIHENDPIVQMIAQEAQENPDGNPEEIEEQVVQHIAQDKKIPEQSKPWLMSALRASKFVRRALPLIAGLGIALSTSGNIEKQSVSADTNIENVASPDMGGGEPPEGLEGYAIEDFEADPDERYVTLESGDTVWDIVNEMLEEGYGGEEVPDKLVRQIVDQVLSDNGLDEESAKNLKPGDRLDVNAVWRHTSS